MTHTSTPWHLYDDDNALHAPETDNFIASFAREDDSRYALHCVNTHDALVAALRFYADKESYIGKLNVVIYESSRYVTPVIEDRGHEAREALKQVEGHNESK